MPVEFVLRIGSCSVIVQSPPLSNVRRIASASAAQASVFPSRLAQSSNQRIGATRSMMRESGALAGAATPGPLSLGDPADGVRFPLPRVPPAVLDAHLVQRLIAHSTEGR